MTSLMRRPLAGTRRRGKTPEDDEALEKELLADAKECSEHVMLVDLGRNDVGKVRALLAPPPPLSLYVLVHGVDLRLPNTAYCTCNSRLHASCDLL